MERFRDKKIFRYELNNLRKKNRDEIYHFIVECSDNELEEAMELVIKNPKNYHPEWSNFTRANRITALYQVLNGGITELGFRVLPVDVRGAYKEVFNKAALGLSDVNNAMVKQDIDKIQSVIQKALDEDQ